MMMTMTTTTTGSLCTLLGLAAASTTPKRHVLRRDASAESPNSSASRIAVGSPVQLKADVDLAWSLIARFGEDPDEEDDPSDATIDLLWRVLMRRATKTESTANARVDQTTIDVDGIGMGAAEPARAASSPFHVSDTAQALQKGKQANMEVKDEEQWPWVSRRLLNYSSGEAAASPRDQGWLDVNVSMEMEIEIEIETEAALWNKRQKVKV
ncbi:hypothetical protein ATCC90586_010998 [Pythium insidiosum]|nr:hypothetical protein ATCC90586_010998 [Pythium insidiosum]